MPMRIRQLQRDVNEREEAEMRRLEGGSQVGGDAMHSHVLVAQPVQAEGGAVVSGAAQRTDKLFANGGFRDSAKIFKLLPRGGAGLQAKVPRRKNYGAEGEAGDAAHSTAMKEFGSSSLARRT